MKQQFAKFENLIPIKNFKIFVGSAVRFLFKVLMIFTWVVDYVVIFF